MSSARPMTPSSATDLWAAMTSSMPGRRVVHQPLAGRRVDGAARAEDGLVLGLGHGAHQAEGSGAGAAPHQRRLAPGGVVRQGLAGVVVGPVQHRVAVVGHRVRTHHPHPRHRAAPQAAGLKSCQSLLSPYYWCDLQQFATTVQHDSVAPPPATTPVVGVGRTLSRSADFGSLPADFPVMLRSATPRRHCSMAHIEKQPSGRLAGPLPAPDGRAQLAGTFDKKVDAERFLIGIEHSKLMGGYVDPGAGKVTLPHIRRGVAGGAAAPAGHGALGRASAPPARLPVHRAPAHRRHPAQRARSHGPPPGRQAGARRPSEVIFGRVVTVFRAAVRDRVVTASPCVGIRLPPREAALDC